MTTTINASTTAGLVNTADTSGVLALQTAGTTAVTVDASQNVGIGTASPSYKLDVVRSGNGVSARFSQGSFFTYIYSGSAASYFSADTGALTSYGLTASTLQMSAGNGADQLVVSQTSVKPNVLLDISGASAGQIQFPATQNASANANTLDDYEEGTWTPVMSGSTTAGTGTYNGQVGSYVKIGSVVYYTLDLSWTNHTGTGNMNLSGLPFTSNGTYCAGSCRAGTGLALTASHYIQAFVNINATTFSWEQFPVGGGFQSAIPMDTSGAIMITGFYRV